jgi:hypothetical protein
VAFEFSPNTGEGLFRKCGNRVVYHFHPLATQLLKSYRPSRLGQFKSASFAFLFVFSHNIFQLVIGSSWFLRKSHDTEIPVAIGGELVRQPEQHGLARSVPSPKPLRRKRGRDSERSVRTAENCIPALVAPSSGCVESDAIERRSLLLKRRIASASVSTPGGMDFLKVEIPKGTPFGAGLGRREAQVSSSPVNFQKT